MFVRWDRARLRARRCRLIAGSWPTDLGFDGATANSIDATSDRDFAMEFVNALSMLAAHLSRWAEEMILFSTQEYGFIVLARGLFDGQQRHAAEEKSRPA